MKWFKHDTSARNDTRLKLLKKKFGAEGYGVYFQMLEIIGENIKENNQKDWGFVESIHTIETLADESGVSPDRLREILSYTNEIGLLYKVEGRLCAPKILTRLDEYAHKRKKGFDVFERKNELEGQYRDDVPTQSGESRALEQNKKRTEGEENKNMASAEAPGKKNITGMSKIGDILNKKQTDGYRSTFQEIKGIHTEWQEKAFRYADKLGITLGQHAKGRWLKIFKQASEGRKTANLEAAYRYIVDYPKPMSNEQKMLFFFKIYENGMEWLQNEKSHT